MQHLFMQLLYKPPSSVKYTATVANILLIQIVRIELTPMHYIRRKKVAEKIDAATTCDGIVLATLLAA